MPIKSTAAKNTIPEYIGYLRVSKDDETTGSHTFETQEKRIREALDRRDGKGQYRLEIFKDDGLSGGLSFRSTAAHRKTRPTLTEITKRIQHSQCDGLIIYGQNRLFRNVQGLSELINEVLLPTNTPLLSATEDLDITTSDGRAMAYLRGIFDEKVREDIKKRNRDAAATRAEQGYPVGQVGYGWKWEEIVVKAPGVRRGILPVEGERHWLIHIKDRYLSGWNAPRITAELNELGVPSPMHRALWDKKRAKRAAQDGRNPQWTASQVWCSLRSPLHSGQIRLKSGELIEGKHWEHRFWEPEVLDQLEALHSQRIAKFKTITGRRNSPTLLNGLAFCARCGSRLYVSASSETTRNHISYKCRNGAQVGKPTCPDVVARAQWVEDVLVEELAQIAHEPQMRGFLQEEMARATADQDGQLCEENAQLKRKLAQLQEQEERWADSYSRGVMTEKQFIRFSQKLEVDEQEITSRLELVETQLSQRSQREAWLQQVQHALLDFPLIWSELDNDEKRQLLLLMLEEKGLRLDRYGRDILVKIKLHLLPEKQRTIIYRSFQGRNRSEHCTGEQRLTKTQMTLLYHQGQGKSRREAAELMGCKPSTIYTLEKTIRKNLGGVAWEQAIEMTRERIEANVSQLPIHGSGPRTKDQPHAESTPFLSPILIEVLTLFAQGATTGEVAKELNLPAYTVQGRRKRILHAFKTKSMLEAVRAAKEQSILVA